MEKPRRPLQIPLLVAAISLLLLGACQRTESPENSAVDTPTSEPVVVIPEPRGQAPKGIYFLKARVTLNTPDGVVAFPPGTRVERQKNGRFLAGGHLVKLKADQLTNDLALASRIAKSEQAALATPP